TSSSSWSRAASSSRATTRICSLVKAHTPRSTTHNSRHRLLKTSELRSVLRPGREDPAFPTLSETQIERIRAFGRERVIDVGDVLFGPADETYDFIVVLDGEVEIVRQSPDGDVVIIRHGPGRFLGDI